MSNSNSSQSIEAPSLREFYSDVEVDPDVDMDSLHVLPLSIVPFATSGLKRARMIKNVQLDSVIELFKGTSSGSGQIEISKIDTVFDLSEEKSAIDKTIIEQLSNINSYDIYTLRINLRKLSIQVDENEKLQLSENKSKELIGYMTEFTKPLIKNIYGNQEKEINSVNQLIEMFKNPDQDLALKNLRELADGLQMDLIEIPNFLEDYGDIFLSLAYFQECAEKIIPSDVERYYPRFLSTCKGHDCEPPCHPRRSSLWFGSENGSLAREIRRRSWWTYAESRIFNV